MWDVFYICKIILFRYVFFDLWKDKSAPELISEVRRTCEPVPYINNCFNNFATCLTIFHKLRSSRKICDKCSHYYAAQRQSYSSDRTDVLFCLQSSQENCFFLILFCSTSSILNKSHNEVLEKFLLWTGHILLDSIVVVETKFWIAFQPLCESIFIVEQNFFCAHSCWLRRVL